MLISLVIWLCSSRILIGKQTPSRRNLIKSTPQCRTFICHQIFNQRLSVSFSIHRRVRRIRRSLHCLYRISHLVWSTRSSNSSSKTSLIPTLCSRMINNWLIFFSQRWSFRCTILKRVSSDKVRLPPNCSSSPKENVKLESQMRIDKILLFRLWAQEVTSVRSPWSQINTEEQPIFKQKITVISAISPKRLSMKSLLYSQRSETPWSKIWSNTRINIDAGKSSNCSMLTTFVT